MSPLVLTELLHQKTYEKHRNVLMMKTRDEILALDISSANAQMTSLAAAGLAKKSRLGTVPSTVLTNAVALVKTRSEV